MQEGAQLLIYFDLKMHTEKGELQSKYEFVLFCNQASSCHRMR